MNANAQEILSKLTLEQKASLCSGYDFWHLKGNAELQIPTIMVTDGPHGLRKQAGETDHIGLLGSAKATCFPTASATASTWEPELLYTMGEALGEEWVASLISTEVLIANLASRGDEVSVAAKTIEEEAEDILCSCKCRHQRTV